METRNSTKTESRTDTNENRTDTNENRTDSKTDHVRKIILKVPKCICLEIKNIIYMQ